MTRTSDPIDVSRDDSRGRFQITVGGTPAGFASFIAAGPEGPPERIFYHTEVDGSFSGQGLASKLVAEAMDDSAQASTTVVPVCPYVKKWLDEHPEHPVKRTRPTPAHLKSIPRTG